MTAFQFFRALLFLLLLPFLTFFVCISAIIEIGLLKRPPKNAQKYPRAWARILTSIAGVKVKVTGIEHLDSETTYVFAGNHCSQFDIYSFQGYFPHDFRWIAKKELFAIPVFGRAMKTVGFISIDRSHGRKALQSLSLAARRIADGSSVLIFPEGTRSKNGRLHPFKSGALLLAIKSKAPVVPIGFNNTFSVLPKGTLLPRGGEIVIRIGKPLPTDHFTTKDKQQLAVLLHDQVAELLDEQHQPATLNQKPIPA